MVIEVFISSHVWMIENVETSVPCSGVSEWAAMTQRLGEEIQACCYVVKPSVDEVMVVQQEAQYTAIEFKEFI